MMRAVVLVAMCLAAAWAFPPPDQMEFANKGAILMPKMQSCTEFIDSNRMQLALQLQATEDKHLAKRDFCRQFADRNTVEKCYVVINNADSYESFLMHIGSGLDNPVHTCQQMYGIE